MKQLLYILLLTQIIFINNACQKTEVPAAAMADRTKKVYGKKIEPDIADADQQRYLQEAIIWLKQ